MKIGTLDITNCKIGSTQVNEIRIGSTLVWQFSSLDPDAQAFITAAGITNPTQQTAINTLVVSLKAYGIWTKMKAIYPFVGGTATTHKFNLKNPADTNAAFRLSFLGGWTHSSNGATPSGVNSYANTFLIPNNTLTNISNHYSFYSRTSILQAATEVGAYTPLAHHAIMLYRSDLSRKAFINGTYPTYAILVNNTNTLGFQIGTRTTSNSMKLFWNNSLMGTNTTNSTLGLPLKNVYISALNNDGVAVELSTKQAAFSSIGDGLTDTEAANFYTAVQAFQTSLGRSVGPQTVSDADAQAFVTAANIQDQVQADAVNNLVIGLKADGLWTKMKAIYPFVGGDATSHSYNLKNTAQFQMTWVGGLTHNSNGVAGNGTNGYGNTNFNYITQGISANNHHVGIYINIDNNTGIDFGADNGVSNFYLSAKASILSNNARFQTETTDQSADANSLGYYIGNRENATTRKLFKNNNLIASRVFTLSQPFQNLNATIGALNRNGTASFFTNKRYCFLNIGDGLTDTEAANLYTRVQAFQTTLGRQV